MENLLIAVCVALGCWYTIKLWRERWRFTAEGRRQMMAQRQAAAEAQQSEQAAIDRIGAAGTMTMAQAKKLRDYNFEPNKQWSFEEAALFIDTVDYLREVCRRAVDAEREPPIDAQNALLKFILTDEARRDHVREWGDDRRDRGLDGPPFELDESADCYQQVAGEARELAGVD